MKLFIFALLLIIVAALCVIFFLLGRMYEHVSQPRENYESLVEFKEMDGDENDR